MCESFDLDPAWQGWQRWYFGTDDPPDDLPPPDAPTEQAERELATVH